MALDLQIPCLAKVALSGIASGERDESDGPLKRVARELVKTGRGSADKHGWRIERCSEGKARAMGG